MVYDFVITLKHYDYRFVDRVSQIMYVFAILVFGYFFYMGGMKELFYPVLMMILTAIWYVTNLKYKRTGFTLYRFGLLVAGVGFFYGPEKNIWMGVLYAIASLIERYVKTAKEIGFTENEIAFNSFPKKRKDWNEFNNVLIKDGLITLDHKNNKLFQKEIEGNVPPQMELEFNEFCRVNLLKSKERVAPVE